MKIKMKILGIMILTLPFVWVSVIHGAETPEEKMARKYANYMSDRLLMDPKTDNLSIDPDDFLLEQLHKLPANHTTKDTDRIFRQREMLKAKQKSAKKKNQDGN